MVWKFLKRVALTGILALALSTQAQAQGLRIYGALSNFDCYNDTNSETEGFEIECDGIHKEDVYHTWNYSAFGAPIVKDGGTPSAPTAIVRYLSPTASVRVGGVTHFGVSLRTFLPSSAIHYRWLPKATAAIPNPPPVPVGLPTHQSQVVYTNGVPMVHDVITNPAPIGGKSIWVLPFAHVVRHKVHLEDLMPDDPTVQNGVPKGGGPDGLNPERIDPGESWTNDEQEQNDDDDSAVFSYEIYEDVVTDAGHGKKNHAPGRMISNMMDATITASGPLVPNELTLSDTIVYGTQTITGTVAINGFAPAGGTVIDLETNSAGVSVPASVTVPANQLSTTFTITTTPVATPTTVTVTATAHDNGGFIQGGLTVKPPDLTTLWLAFSANFSGSTFEGEVDLIAPAPVGGMRVNLSSSDSTVASVPIGVTVPEGAKIARFTVQAGMVAVAKTVTIQAVLGAVSQSQNLVINPSPRNLTGIVSLEGCVNPLQPLDFVLRPRDGSPEITRTLTLGAGGTFEWKGVPLKKYDLAIKGHKWLRSVVPNIDTTVANVSGVSASLRAGDANGDNSVNFDDFQILADAYFTSTGETFFDERADFDCNGEVNFDDFLLLAQNYFTDGDE